jgi:hypothetical protein
MVAISVETEKMLGIGSSIEFHCTREGVRGSLPKWWRGRLAEWGRKVAGVVNGILRRR